MTWLGRALTGVAIFAALYGVFQWQYPTYSYRFRVTIEIEAPDGSRSGSSVLQVKTVQYPSWITLGANGSRTSVEGEAITVDLGGGRALVGLLVFGNVGQYSIIDLPVQAILGKTRYGHSYLPDWTRELSRNSQRFQLEPKLYPLLMVFPDIARPDSGIVVTGDNLESLLGAKGRIRSASLEILPSAWSLSDYLGYGPNSLNHSIEKRIPWATDFRSARQVWSILDERARGKQFLVGDGPLELFKR